MDIRAYHGKWKGRRTAHVIDHTLGGNLCVCFGRLPSEAWLGHRHKIFSIDIFNLWIKKYNAKKVY